MKVIVLSIQNNLLSGAILKYLIERGEMIPKRVQNHNDPNEPYQSCITLNADVVLMETSNVYHFTLDKRLNTIEKLRKDLPNCKIAILCDEYANPEIAERIKDMKALGLIDGFFHSSVTGEYISAALDAL